jgi:hypothetical protein
MSGGGGSGSDGSNDTDVSGAEAVATGGSTYSDRKIDNSVGYTSQDNVREQQRGDNQYYRARTQAAQVDAEDEYDAPDRDHFNQTQKEISQKNRELAKSGQLDTSMTKEQYDQFNKEMNQYYGTENVKYEPYGRAGKGTVNLTFKEHWDNVGMQNPVTKYSPLARFLIASGRNAKEALTSDYGTYKYAGPGTDQGGLLGRIGGSNADISLGATQSQRDVMNELAPEAPYIVSGITRPTNSPAAQWYQSLGNTSTNQFQFSFANELAAAKAKQASILGNPSPIGQLAVSNSPFYNWLKERSLDKGIL